MLLRLLTYSIAKLEMQDTIKALLPLILLLPRLQAWVSTATR